MSVMENILEQVKKRNPAIAVLISCCLEILRETPASSAITNIKDPAVIKRTAASIKGANSLTAILLKR